MIVHLATVLVVAAPSEAINALHEHLKAESYQGTLCHSLEQARASLALHRPDVVIVGPDISDSPSLDATLRALRAEVACAGLPLFALSERPLAASGMALLEAGADDAAPWPESPSSVLARVRPLVRVSTMQAELTLRTTLAQSFAADVDASVRVGDDPFEVLVIGGAAPLDLTRHAMPQARVEMADDLVSAQKMMEERTVDAALLAPGVDEQAAYLDLCLQVRRNPRLFNLPMIFLAPKDATLSPADTARILTTGASHVLSSPVEASGLAFAFTALVRRQRLRWAIRRALSQTLADKTRDSVVAGVYSQEFVQGYLARSVAQSLSQGRQMSVICFGFAGVDALRHEFGEEAENGLLTQIGQWLTLLVRAEDLVARQDGPRFTVLLPDTPESEAQVVMHRIAGVISNTEFAVPDVYRPVTVWPYVNATALAEGDTPETLLGRAAAAVDAF